MKILSWNVAGIRATIKKGGLDFLLSEEWDIVCFQETKAEEEQVKLCDDLIKIYPYRYWNSCQGITQRKGLNGTSIWSKKKPIREIPHPDFDVEGRITTIEYPECILVTVYTPNSQSIKSERHKHRIEEWDVKFLSFIKNLDKICPTIVCGDLNVAREDKDVFAPDKLRNKCAGFLDVERINFEKYIMEGWVDSYREKYPDKEGAFTYWDQKIKTRRPENLGWRIDYFLVPQKIKDNIKSAEILAEVMGSDHCPIILDISLKKSPRKIKVVDNIIKTT